MNNDGDFVFNSNLNDSRDVKFPHALILAGGKSSRMGADKTLMPFAGRPSFTHFLFERLSEFFTDVKVSTKTQKFNPPLPLLLDEFEDFCPLFALASLDKYYREPVFIVSADSPFVKFETVRTLYSNLKNHQISLPRAEGKTHNLCGFFDPSVAGAARELAKSGERRISALVLACDSVITEFSDAGQFLNLNTPQDLAKIDEKNLF